MSYLDALNEEYDDANGFDDEWSADVEDCHGTLHPVNEYAASVAQEADQKAREREAFRLASHAHHLLSTTGGFTLGLNAATGYSNTPISGFMVGDGKSEVRVRTCTTETIYRFMLEHWTRLADPSLFLGGWQADEFVYLDISKRHESYCEAISVARQLGEIAVYDVESGISIPV